MRKATADRIDAHHAEIKRLIEAEKAHHDRAHPDENDMWRHIEHTNIEMHALSPQARGLMHWASATLPAGPSAKQEPQPIEKEPKMSQIVIFPRGQLAPDEKDYMRSLGIVAIEADDPKAVVCVVPAADR